MKQPVSSDEMRLLFRKLEGEKKKMVTSKREKHHPRRLDDQDGRHSQVLEGQHGEGAGPDVANSVVAKVQRFQAQEGLQLLRGDPRDPVVSSGNTHTHTRHLQ